MEWQKLIADGYEWILQVLEKALNGLKQDDLNKQGAVEALFQHPISGRP